MRNVILRQRGERIMDALGLEPREIVTRSGRPYDGRYRITEFDERKGTGYAVQPKVCHRCGGAGKSDRWAHTGYTCYECGGSGTLGVEKVRLYSPEKVAKLDEALEKRRATKQAKRLAELDAKKQESGMIERIDSLREIDDDFIRSLVRQFDERGNLTPKQVAAIDPALDRIEKRKAVEEALVDAPAGRHEVTGEIVKTKWVDSYYGSQAKMLLDCGNYKLWGTIPAKLIDEAPDYRASNLVGKTVRMTATVEPKERGFGFFSRPTKPELV